ncbi:uncharacterized protein LOC132902157, partial [Amyelois transitella]|uniref:uncharacterized protein LOC132902157 n=1 Tax=Amyelois transitella TaxID=680683 RepID=UPI00298FEBDA
MAVMQIGANPQKAIDKSSKEKAQKKKKENTKLSKFNKVKNHGAQKNKEEFIPMGSYPPNNRQLKPMRDSRYYTKETLCAFCDFCDAVAKIARDFFDFAEKTTNVVLDYLYIGKLKLINTVQCNDLAKEDVDKVIEDEITEKLSEDLVQSIEKKFHVDLERSVDMVLMKIKLLLQNGTNHIQDRLADLQNLLETIKKDVDNEVDACLLARQNETAALAEKALHQMVVCGYALIGHDPTEAVKNVIQMKNMIKEGLTPIYDQKPEIYNLLKVCGHEHDTLKKVVKCVISKSPVIKSAMMDVTSKLIQGVVELTKLMAHGAMHEACLIEVVKSVEDEAFVIVDKVKGCSYGNSTDVLNETEKYIKDNNATVLNLDGKDTSNNNGVQEILKKMLTPGDANLKNELTNLNAELGSIASNFISKE